MRRLAGEYGHARFDFRIVKFEGHGKFGSQFLQCGICVSRIQTKPRTIECHSHEEGPGIRVGMLIRIQNVPALIAEERGKSRHNAGTEPATAPYIPWEMVWHNSKPSRKEAMELENKLKNLSRARLEAFIKKYGGG